jgi:nitrite reductase/ring-hydroxylating ferredoxin subunit
MKPINQLIRGDEVHADVYIDPALFALEQERLFARTWQYVGHASQVPNTGDFYSVEIAGQPLIMLRRQDGSVGVLENRCAHKGTAIVNRRAGNTGKSLQCPYHGWSYRLDGSLLAMPLRSEYNDTSLHTCLAGKGLVRPSAANHRGFVFVRLSADGPSFEEYAGAMTAVLDNLVDRSPEGTIEIAGGCLRSVMQCNWKMYLENVNDAIHALPTHGSVVSATTSVWNARADQSARHTSVEQLLPFGVGLDFVRGMGGRVYPNGHSILGTSASLHAGYASLADYEASMLRAYGESRAKEILSFSPQNAILFPGLAVKCSPQLIRVIRPLAVDKTLIEAWAFKLRGAPEELLSRSVNYTRLVYSPMSPVAHDDIHIFETIQRSLHSRGNPWVSFHRLHQANETDSGDIEHSGTSEILMRNQFLAWSRWMAPPTSGAIS